LSYLPGTTATDIASAKDRSFTLGFMPGSVPREQRARAHRWTSGCARRRRGTCHVGVVARVATPAGDAARSAMPGNASNDGTAEPPLRTRK
jgi:hypothetical protein